MLLKLRYLISFVLDFICDALLSLRRCGSSRMSAKPEILVVKLDAIGDFILWLDAAAELRRMYPVERYHLVLLGNSAWAELAEKLSYFDEVIAVNRSRLRFDQIYRAGIWRLLQDRLWEKAIHPTYSRDYLYGDSVIRMSRATERIGFDGDLDNQPEWQKRISDQWYTRLVPSSGKALMELERNAEFLRGLGRADFLVGLPELDLLAELPTGFTTGIYAVIAPGASLPIKQWPLENFAQLAKRILETGVRIVICGSLAEISLGAQLKNLLTDDVEDWTGRTSLPELVSIIKGACLLIGNDSSAIHIAAAVGTQSFCIAGGWHFGRFIPYRIERATPYPLPIILAHHMECYLCNWRCRYSPDGAVAAPCVTRIGVDVVWSEVTDYLAQHDCGRRGLQ